MRYVLQICIFCSIAAIAGSVLAQGKDYDPLLVIKQHKLQSIELVVNDSHHRRAIPILVYLPQQNTSAPVVLFSHGLGGSRYGCSYLGKHWSARGYIAVFVQHPGSDVSVWKNVARGQRMHALRNAASARNFFLRVKDIPVVLDQLTHWNATNGHILAGRMDFKRVGMSGHSFGALTTQAVSGQQTWRGDIPFTDLRIKAAIAFSPSSPRRGSAKQAFADVNIPWLLMTGTKDIAKIGGADLKSRLAVFPALPPGGKYELVLYNAEHSAFSDRRLPGDRTKRKPNHHQSILAISTAFWDTWLRDDARAKAWLNGHGPQSLLEKKDRWQTK